MLSGDLDPSGVQVEAAHREAAAHWGSMSTLAWPRITVPETNSPHPRRRPEWFAAVADWLASNGGRRMMSFSKEDGPLSGPWLPDDTATIDALNALMTKYGT